MMTENNVLYVLVLHSFQFPPIPFLSLCSSLNSGKNEIYQSSLKICNLTHLLDLEMLQFSKTVAFYKTIYNLWF